MIKTYRRINKIALAAVTLSLILSSLSCGTKIDDLNSSGKNTEQVFNVSDKKGTTISVKINPRRDSFFTKGTSNGVRAKTYLDIKSYRIYLIKSATAVFPLNGDPLNGGNIAYSVNVNANEDSTAFVTFSNVLNSAGTYYHVAVRAYDGPLSAGVPTGTEIIKQNNGSATAWTSTASFAPVNGRVAVSTGNGVQVDSSLVVSSPTALEVTPNLLDMIGATIDSDITATGAFRDRVAYYMVNFCTDPTRPVKTQVFATPLKVNRNYTQYTSAFLHKLQLNNLPPGTYYATVQAFDADNNILTTANNSGTVYNAPDAGANVGVSTSKVDVSSNFALTFTPPAPTKLDISLKFSDYQMKTIAGTGPPAGDAPVADSVATNTVLNYPRGIAVDSSGNVYIANSDDDTIRKVTPAGMMSTIAGTGVRDDTPLEDSVATSTPLNAPVGVAVDSSGNVYFSNLFDHTIRKVTPAGMMSTIAGTGVQGNPPLEESVATNTPLNNPRGVAVDSSGNVYIANSINSTIRKVTPGGMMSTVAGTGVGGNDPVANSVATNTKLFFPQSVAVDSLGNVYIANTLNHTIRKVTPGGMMSTIAGNGPPAGNAPVADSVATNTQLNFPYGVTVDKSGNVYIANGENNTVRKVTPTGMMSTIAGTGILGDAPPGADSIATNTQLNFPAELAVDSFGNVYVATTNNHTVRKVF